VSFHVLPLIETRRRNNSASTGCQKAGNLTLSTYIDTRESSDSRQIDGGAPLTIAFNDRRDSAR